MALPGSVFVHPCVISVSLPWRMPFCTCRREPLCESCVPALTSIFPAALPTLQVHRAAPPTDRGRGAGAQCADAASPLGGAAERTQSLGSRMPSRGPRHLPPALSTRARALPQRPARGAPSAGGARQWGKAAVGPRESWAGAVGGAVRSQGQGRSEGQSHCTTWGSVKGERADRSPGLGESSPLLSLTPPERAVHRCHQLPVPALLLSRHHGAQAVPPAGAARGRPHQPHPAPAGQGRACGHWRDGMPSCVLNRSSCWTAVYAQLVPGTPEARSLVLCFGTVLHGL